MGSPNKSLHVMIPVVMSSTIDSNGLTPYINYFIERIYMAYHINKFTKFAGLTSLKKIGIAVSAIFGTLATVAKVYDTYVKHFKGKNKELQIGSVGNKKTVKRNTSDNTQYIDESIYLYEKSDIILDKPTTVELGDTYIQFTAVNFITDKDIDEFRMKTSDVSSLFKRIAARFKSTVSIVTNDVFYVYSVEEVDDEKLRSSLQDKNKNVVIVDTVNDLITAYIKLNGKITKTSAKLSKITNDKKKYGDDLTIDDIVKSLKGIRTIK